MAKKSQQQKVKSGDAEQRGPLVNQHKRMAQGDLVPQGNVPKAKK